MGLPQPAFLQNPLIRNGVRNCLLFLGLVSLIVSISGTTWYGITAESQEYGEELIDIEKFEARATAWKITAEKYSNGELSFEYNSTHSDACYKTSMSFSLCYNLLGSQRSLLSAMIIGIVTTLGDLFFTFIPSGQNLAVNSPIINRLGITALAIVTSLCCMISFSMFASLEEHLMEDYKEELDELEERAFRDRSLFVDSSRGYNVGFAMAILAFIFYFLGAVYNFLYCNQDVQSFKSANHYQNHGNQENVFNSAEYEHSADYQSQGNYSDERNFQPQIQNPQGQVQVQVQQQQYNGSYGSESSH